MNTLLCSEASRGAAFGALYLTGAVGAMLGALFATNLGATFTANEFNYLVS